MAGVTPGNPLMRPQNAADWYALINRERQRALWHRTLENGIMGGAMVLALLAGLGMRYRDDALAFLLMLAAVPPCAFLVYFMLRGKKACCPACQYNWEFKGHSLILRLPPPPGVDVWEECPQCTMPLRYPALEQWVAWHT